MRDVRTPFRNSAPSGRVAAFVSKTRWSHLEVTSTDRDSATVTLAAVQMGLLLIDRWGVASVPNGLIRTAFVCW